MMIDASDEEARLRVSDKVPASSGGFFLWTWKPSVHLVEFPRLRKVLLQFIFLLTDGIVSEWVFFVFVFDKIEKINILFSKLAKDK